MKFSTQRMNERGQGLVEYGLLVLLIGVATLAAIAWLNDGIQSVFRDYVSNTPAVPEGITPVGGQFGDRIPLNPENQPPVPGISTDPSPPVVPSGDTITFTSTSYDPDDGDSIVLFEWDIYGDGSLIKTGPVVTHVYTTTEDNAVWQPRLTVEDSNGVRTSTYISVGAYNTTPPNLPPVAEITVNPLTGSAPLTVTFASTSYDPDGTIVEHRWDFGEGLQRDGTTEVHVYNTPGDYEAELLITDNGGRQAKSYRVLITLEEPPPPNEPPTASIRSSVLSGLTGVAVDFYVDTFADSDGSVEYYEWDFGDGSATVGPHIVGGGIPIVPHTFDNPGSYTAKLTIWDNDGDTASEQINLVIAERTCDNAYIKRQIWNGISGTKTSNLTSLSTFPLSPDVTETLTAIQEPAGASGNNYGARYLGFIVPPSTGDYIFYTSSDDASDVYLSTDESPANVSRIAYVTRWTPNMDWGRESNQVSAPISLVAGQKYYFEVHHKEGGGGDNLAVGWIQPGASYPPEVITGDYLCFDEDLVPPAPTPAPSPTPVPTATPLPGACQYEAETAILSGPSVKNNHGGYSGSGFADYPGSTGSNVFVEWNVNAASAGNYSLAFFYALSSGSRPLELKVNGVVQNSSVPFSSTGGWSKWKSVAETVTLNAGNNTIRLTARSNQGPNVDCLRVDQVSPPTTNLALNKSANQSSTGWSGAASRAVDGNTSGQYGNNSVTHTGSNTNAWWQVDLGSVSQIDEITLWNRTDCCSSRLSNVHIFVSDTPFNSTSLTGTQAQSGVSEYYTSGAWGSSGTVSVNRTGRYVRVQLAGTNYLSLAEVEVMGIDGP
ncbi:MAG: PKD domain-containing protein [Chloroflexota bacterium]